MISKIGICSLCGQEKELTFEHIPPRAAFNSHPVKPVTGKELFKENVLNDKSRLPWNTEGLPYLNQQQGMGRYSLCKECNNNTGTWYGEEYVKFARTVHKCFTEVDDSFEGTVELKEVYPLRIIKQIISMFCSLTDSTNNEINDLRNFVLDKNKKGIDKSKYRIHMYLSKSTLHKQTGDMVLLKDNGKIYSMKLNEITCYPFGFILYYEPKDFWDFRGVDITSFSDFAYDDCCNVFIPWILQEVNSWIPEDFRTREEIINTIKRNEEGIKNEENGK